MEQLRHFEDLWINNNLLVIDLQAVIVRLRTRKNFTILPKKYYFVISLWIDIRHKVHKVIYECFQLKGHKKLK